MVSQAIMLYNFLVQIFRIFRSFCSKSVKRHLKSLNVSDVDLRIVLRKQPGVCLMYCHVSAEVEYSEKNFVPVSVKIKVGVRNGHNSYDKILDITSECLNFKARDYLLHFVDVLNNPHIDVVYEEGDDSLADFPIRVLTCRNVQSQNKVLQDAMNNAKNLRVRQFLKRSLIFVFQMFGPTPPYHSSHQVLFKNFYEVLVGFLNLDLNSLLTIESPIVKVRSTEITENDLGLFLKHWMLDCANRNLKYLEIKCKNKLNETTLCKGIKYRQQLETIKRTFEYKDPMGGFRRSETVYGGYDISRSDGVQAIFFCDLWFFYFMIWD